MDAHRAAELLGVTLERIEVLVQEHLRCGDGKFFSDW
jgi:hypothetical protein